jgi:hypothetical protein
MESSTFTPFTETISTSSRREYSSMPQRTNEFQKLVYLVRKHSAAGSTVTESKLLTDSNGSQREVDICIEDSIDGIPVTISIECCDLARPATVE